MAVPGWRPARWVNASKRWPICKRMPPDQWAAVEQQQHQWPQQQDSSHPWLTTSFGDWLPHVNAIALAFSPGRGLPLMAISCGGPSRLISSDMLLHRAKPELERMVRRLQQAIYRA